MSFLLTGVSGGLANGRFSPKVTGDSRVADTALGTVPALLDPGTAGGVPTAESIISSEMDQIFDKQYRYSHVC